MVGSVGDVPLWAFILSPESSSPAFFLSLLNHKASAENCAFTQTKIEQLWRRVELCERSQAVLSRNVPLNLCLYHENITSCSHRPHSSQTEWWQQCGARLTPPAFSSIWSQTLGGRTVILPPQSGSYHGSRGAVYLLSLKVKLTSEFCASIWSQR